MLTSWKICVWCICWIYADEFDVVFTFVFSQWSNPCTDTCKSKLSKHPLRICYVCVAHCQNDQILISQNFRLLASLPFHNHLLEAFCDQSRCCSLTSSPPLHTSDSSHLDPLRRWKSCTRWQGRKVIGNPPWNTSLHIDLTRQDWSDWSRRNDLKGQKMGIPCTRGKISRFRTPGLSTTLSRCKLFPISSNPSPLSLGRSPSGRPPWGWTGTGSI